MVSKREWFVSVDFFFFFLQKKFYFIKRMLFIQIRRRPNPFKLKFKCYFPNWMLNNDLDRGRPQVGQKKIQHMKPEDHLLTLKHSYNSSKDYVCVPVNKSVTFIE